MAVTLAQAVYRFRADSLAADGGTPTWGAAQNAPYAPPPNTPFALRFIINSTGTQTNTNNPFQLYFSKNGGAYNPVNSAGVISVDRTLGASADNSSIATANFRLTGGTGTPLAGEYDDTGATANYQLTHGDFTEFEFGLELDATLTAGDTIDYRVYFNGSPLSTYTVTPRTTVLISAAVGSSDGVGDAPAIGAEIISASGSSSGVGFSAAQGTILTASTDAVIGSVGECAVAENALSDGGTVTASVGSAAGIGDALAVGSLGIPTSPSVGDSSGVSTVAGIGSAVGADVGLAAGVSSVAAVGVSIFAGVGVSSGVSAVAAVGSSNAASIASSNGVGAASGAGARTVAVVGAAAGIGAANGSASNIVPSVGAASGTSASLGVGFWYLTTASVLRPNADNATGSWLNESGGSSLYPSIDEVSPLDSNYIKSSDNPLIPDTCKVALNAPAGLIQLPLTVSYRYKKLGPSTANLRVRLMEGATEIAAWTNTGISDSYATKTETLTSLQLAAIGNPANLFLEMQASVP